jgi:hypothetical protein
VIPRTERDQAILDGFRAVAAKMIGQWDGFGVIERNDNIFRGPDSNFYIVSTPPEGNDVILRIRHRNTPWRREIRIAPNNSRKESTNGGPVEHSNAHFPSEQTPIIRRLFDDIRDTTNGEP